jgi:hypothetical protein
MAISPYELYKAQAEILVPVVRALLDEIGTERTHSLVSKAIGPYFRDMGKAFFGQLEGGDFGAKMNSLWKAYNADGTFDYTIEQETEKTLYARVDACGFAKLYRDLNAPELGFLLCCGQDYPLTDGLHNGAVMRRPKTLMQGHDHCEFYWDLHEDSGQRDAERGKELARVGVEQMRLLAKEAAKRKAQAT